MFATGEPEAYPTRFIYRYGGRQVHLCGTFTRWLETVPMQPLEGHPGCFTAVCSLPPGYHQYKFIVDGEWRHDDQQPFMQDPLGNVNNWVFVKRPDGMPPQDAAQHAQGAASAAAAASSGGGGRDGMDWAASGGPQPGAGGAWDHTMAGGAPPHAPATPPTPGGGVPPHPGGGVVSHDPTAMTPTQVTATAAAPTASAASGRDTAASAPTVAPGAVPGAGPVTGLVEDADGGRTRVTDFLSRHSAYELLPESSKVILLDVGLPVRQAYHALHEQGVHAAPIWDPGSCTLVGVISSSDFIDMLRRLRAAAGPALSVAELEAHTLGQWRAAAAAAAGGGQQHAGGGASLASSSPRPLVWLRPDDSLATVARRLLDSRHYSLPVLATCGTSGREACDPGEAPQLLHLATLSGVLAGLTRHLRHLPIPLLSQPLGALPLGTWVAPDGPPPAALDRTIPLAVGRRHVARLHAVGPHTPLLAALELLSEAGVSALPVVDDRGALLDVYARGDITGLARDNAYRRLQWEDLTVGQALAYTGGLRGTGSPSAGGQGAGRCHVCTAHDSLRSAIETLSLTGARRLVSIDPNSRRPDGIISLSDVAAYLFS